MGATGATQAKSGEPLASPTIRSTYALDPETVERLARLARRWNLSRSATLRRLIREAEAALPPEPDPRLAALRRLQALSRMTSQQRADWQRAIRLERRARDRKRLPTEKTG
ncbi:MAG: ribbon-helix-helix protein, CopG family [Terriglobales bacterium]